MKHEGKNKKRVRNGGENMKFEAMFQPIQIGPMTVANRFVMSPMGNNFANTDGTMSERSASYYGARAKGGFGLITFEATVVYKEAKGGPRKPCLYDDSTGSNCQWRKIENRKYFYFTTLVVTRKDVQEYMKHHSEYTKANRFKDIICKIYI